MIVCFIMALTQEYNFTMFLKINKLEKETDESVRIYSVFL